MNYLLSIQYLRALAAILVVIFHSGTMIDGAPGTFGAGMAGVDIFFVISGLVMWVTARDMAPKVFLMKRITRIVPLYWSVTLFAAFVSFRGGIAIGLDESVADLARSLLFIAYDSGSEWRRVEPIIGPGWTLNYEMLFYALFALGLAMMKRPFWIVSALLVALVAAQMFVAPSAHVAMFYTNSIMVEFIFGMIAGQMIVSGRVAGRWMSLALVVAGAAYIVMNGFGTGLRAIDYGVGAFVLIVGAAGLEDVIRAWPLRLMRLIGDASYSLYLTHIITLGVAGTLLRSLSIRGTILADVIATALCLAVGIATYLLYEKPVGKWIGRRVARKAPASGQ